MNSSPLRILAFAGSTRSGSLNKRLVRAAAAMTTGEGVQTDVIDLADFPMPLYDADLELAQGAPENAERLKALMVEHAGLLLAAPEYNSSITAVLKNAIDWVSRPVSGEPPLPAFRGKVAALLAASPGNLGGLRGLVHVRSILSNLGMIVLPGQVALPNADQGFAEDGSLVPGRQRDAIASLCSQLVEVVRKLHGPTGG